MRIKHLSICVLALLGAVPAYADTIFANIVKVQGPVQSGPAGGLTKIGPAGASVGPGDLVVSGIGGSALMKLTPCSVLSLGPDASVSVDRLQLVKGSTGMTTARSGDFTVSRGGTTFIMESMQGRVNIPGGIISVGTAGTFYVSVSPAGESIISVLSGNVSVTSSTGETISLKAGDFSVISPSGPATATPAAGNPDAESGLVTAQQALEEASTRSLVCDTTVTRLEGEFLQLPPQVVPPTSSNPGRPSTPQRPPVSPDR